MQDSNKVHGGLAEDTPEPIDDVAARDQKEASGELEGVFAVQRDGPALPAATLDTALEGLAASDPRRWGVVVFIKFASAWAKQETTKFTAANKRLESEQLRNEAQAKELAAAREENASLKAGAAERSRHWPIITLGLVCGPILFKMGIDQVIAEHWGTGIGLLIMGLAFTAAAVISSIKKGAQ